MQDSIPGDGAPAAPGPITARQLDRRKPLSRLQRKFGQLVGRLAEVRGELSRWKAYREIYRQRLTERYQPLADRLRRRRIELARLFDRSLDRERLPKRDRAKLEDLLLRSLGELLAEAPDADLVRLYDKYSTVSFAERQRDDMDALLSMAGREFGIDVDAYGGGESPEELADWLREQIRAAETSRTRRGAGTGRRADARTGNGSAAGGGGGSGPGAGKRSGRKPGSPGGAAACERAEGGGRTVREVFRKLVSELHPDRETDPAEQVRKTELMQRVNRAYKSGDLLGLLELQLGMEQIDAASIAELAEDRLRRYLYVLDEQFKRLREELAELVAPFESVVGDSARRPVTPDAVQRVLEADIRALERAVREVEAELLDFQDIRRLKASLERYRIDERQAARYGR